MAYHTYMFVTIFSCIQSETLTHIRHVNISPFKWETIRISDLAKSQIKLDEDISW